MEITDRTNKLKGIICALISSGTFGLIPLFSIPLMRSVHMHGTSILFYRYLFSFIALGSLCLFTKRSLRIDIKIASKLFLLSLLSAATAAALIYSYNYLPSGIATTIHFLYPVVVVFLMAAFFKERISGKLFITAVFALIGVGFLSFPEGSNLSTRGLILALTTVITYASYVAGLNMKGINRVDSAVVTFYIMFFGSILFGIVSLFTNGIDSIPNLNAAFNLIMLALVPTVISVLTLVLAVRYAGSTITSILGASEPLVATIIGILVFSERFTLFSFIGLTIIIIAVSYVVVSTKKT